MELWGYGTSDTLPLSICIVYICIVRVHFIQLYSIVHYRVNLGWHVLLKIDVSSAVFWRHQSSWLFLDALVVHSTLGCSCKEGPVTQIPTLSTSQRRESEDLRLYWECLILSMLLRYDGPCPLRTLKVIEQILNLILKDIGSQWSTFKTGLICSCVGILQRTLAAEFWTIWSLWIKTFGSPAKMALQ